MIVLSGGSLGGQEFDGTLWTDGDTQILDGFIYRRTGDIAVFCGAV